MLNGDVVAAWSYGAGHINNTFLAETDAHDDDATTASSEGGPTTTRTTDRRRRRYLLLRVNGDVFRRPDEVMENVVRVCDDAERRALRLVPTREEAGGSRGGRSSWCFVDLLSFERFEWTNMVGNGRPLMP